MTRLETLFLLPTRSSRSAPARGWLSGDRDAPRVLLAFLMCALPSCKGDICRKEVEAFELEQSLTADDVDELLLFEGAADSDELSCSVVCSYQYQSGPRGEVWSVASCTLEIDPDWDTAADGSEVGTIECSGDAALPGCS